ncbi:hypothetical protein L3X38_017647 [Prunus dulcis]|uniref:BED-type domain-containing protein n=1 Tax=Prunus dulcis TaxID=3755 RepID=A0AAD4ZA85_PRUDU|nr:hypothetical protein L3X38_017647 [Prunus dulcis]
MEAESETPVSTNPPPPLAPSQSAHPQSDPPQSTPSTLGKRKSCKNASGVWDHFTKMKCEDETSESRCICKYCKKDYACDGKRNGTSTLWHHLRSQCKNSPLRHEKRQKVLSFEDQAKGGNLVAHAFSKERCRIACVKMIILDELPFSHVEGIGFREFLKEAQPRFDFPSRTTIAGDVWDLYQEEKAKINSDGSLLHVRCCAHITNLIVTDGMKEIHQSIESICNCAKYIRGSSQRLEKFRACLEMEKVDTRTMVPLDVCARWNSTYMMLESALKLQKGFERMEDDDPNFLGYFEEYEAHGREKKKRVGPPTSLDWDNTKVFVKFLKKSDDATLRFSASKTVSSNAPLHEICSFLEEIDTMMNVDDVVMCKIATMMKRNFDKYWGNVNNINKLFFVAVILDPRYKTEYVEFCLGDLVSDENGVNDMSLEIKTLLHNLYDYYRKQNPAVAQVFHGNVESEGSLHVNNDVTKSSRLQKFLKSRRDKDVVEIRNEINKYLLEPPVNLTNDEFKVIDWWKENATKFPILANVAKDVFVVQASTVASECSFSTGKRVVDPFRSSLTPKTVEALICCSDWLRAEEFSYYKEPVLEELDFYQALEKVEKCFLSFLH